MQATYVIATIVAALANAYAAALNFAGAESVKVVADRVRVARAWMVPLGTLLGLGSVGLLAGFAVPPLGTAAAVGLVLYFIGAVTAHRAAAREPGPAARARRARARSRPRAAAPVVDAFFAASRDGDFDALPEVLDPDVELRIDGGALRADASLVLHGADAVARHTATYARLFPFVRPALVNGAPGAVVAPHGRLFSVMAFTVSGGRITAIDALVDPERLAQLDPRGALCPLRDPVSRKRAAPRA